MRVNLSKNNLFSNGTVLLCAFLVALIGLHHHLLFYIELGHLGYFKNSYDEDTYMLFYESWNVNHFRWFSLLLYHLMSVLFPKILIPIIFDVLLPSLLFLAAYFLSFRLCRSKSLASFISLLFVFSPDLFSFQNLSVYPTFNIQYLFEKYSGLSYYWPNAATSFLGVMRSTEPVLSWIYFSFIFILILDLRELNQNKLFSVSKNKKIVLCSLCFLSAATYSFMFLGFLVFQVLWLFLSILTKNKKEVFSVLQSLTVSLIGLLLFSYWSGTSESAEVIYRSRAPFFSLSFLFLLFYPLAIKLKFSKGTCLAILALTLSPLIIINQQIVTGILVSVRDWEKYVCYFYSTLGLILFLSVLYNKHEKSITRYWKYGFRFSSLILLVFMFVSSKRSYSLWIDSNKKGNSYITAIHQSGLKLENVVFILDDPSLSPYIRWRLELGSENFIIDYTELFHKRIGPMNSEGSVVNLEYHRSNLFSYFSYKQLSDLEVSEILRRQVRMRSGYEISFLFGFKDYWYPITDGRIDSSEKVLQRIPEIVSQYKNKRLDLIRKPGTRIRVTEEFLQSNENWSFELLYSMSGKGLKTIYLYRQIYKSSVL